MSVKSRLLLASLLVCATACSKTPSKAQETPPPAKEQLAAAAEPLTAEAAAADEKAKAVHQRLIIGGKDSQATFLMEAPIEKIRGRLGESSVSGELDLDLHHLSSSTGVLRIDISELELFQTKADDSGKFGEEVKNDKQNDHARAWLEIDEDAPPNDREKNRRVQFAITKVQASTEDLAATESGVVTADLTVQGRLTLHQQTREVSGKLNAEFTMAQGKVVSAHIKTAESIPVRFEDYDVRPREAFGIIAKATLSVLSEKVAQVAEVSLDLHAQAQ